MDDWQSNRVQMLIGSKASNNFWLSFRQNDNPLLQQDVFIRPSVKNEVELLARNGDKISTPLKKMVQQKQCKSQCLNSVAMTYCSCTTLKSYSTITDTKLCNAETMQNCVYVRGATEETNKCLRSCVPESPTSQYTVYVKSSLTEGSSSLSPDNFNLDIKFNLKHNSYSFFSVLCVSIVVAFVAILCIVLFACCCLNALRGNKL